MNTWAEEKKFLVAYPEQPSHANTTQCWNWFHPKHQKRNQGEPALIAGITKQIQDHYKVDPQRIYIAGLSAGASEALIIAQAYPDIFAAVGVHSGLACGAAHDIASALIAMKKGADTAHCEAYVEGGKHPIPTIIFHGNKDMLVHVRNSELVLAQMRAKATDTLEIKEESGKVKGGHSYHRTLYRTANEQQPLLEQWIIHDAGHAWAGGDKKGSYTDPKGPDASYAMVQFFWEHPKAESPVH
jgi:poly(hydroxyalkanoate) depolymerase family esterase